jgi:hypothetical protein
VHAGRDLVTVVSLSIARLRGVPYVCQTHGMIMPRTSPPARLFDRVLRPLLRHAGELFVLTDEETVGLSAVTRGMQPRRIANGVPVVVPAEPRERPAPPPQTGDGLRGDGRAAGLDRLVRELRDLRA